MPQKLLDVKSGLENIKKKRQEAKATSCRYTCISRKRLQDLDYAGVWSLDHTPRGGKFTVRLGSPQEGQTPRDQGLSGTEDVAGVLGAAVPAGWGNRVRAVLIKCLAPVEDPLLWLASHQDHESGF
jgi:hypothetical protein